MIFIGNFEEIESTKFGVGFIHYMPFDEVNGMHKTIDELIAMGCLVEELPEEQHIQGKESKLFFNPVDKVVWYEYEDIPKTPDEIRDEKIALMQAALDELILNGGGF